MDKLGILKRETIERINWLTGRIESEPPFSEFMLNHFISRRHAFETIIERIEELEKL